MPPQEARNVVLKLVLDTIGAEEKASGLVKAIKAVSSEFEAAGQQMENTLRGRLVGNVIGAFRNSFSTLINEEIPEVLRTSKIEVELAAAVAGVFSDQAANIARMLATEQLRRPTTVLQNTTESLLRLTGGGRVDPNEPGFKDFYQFVANSELADYNRKLNFREAVANQFDADPAMPSLRSIDYLGIGAEATKRAFGAVSRIGAAPGGGGNTVLSPALWSAEGQRVIMRVGSD